MTNEIYFHLEGEFLGVCALDGYKLKYLRLRTADFSQESLRQRDIVIKVPKELRAGLVYKLAIGDRLRCEGIQKDLKFKASAIEKVLPGASPAEDRSARLDRSIAAPDRQAKVKILICQKSHCLNNGGTEVYSALTAQLNSCNLNDSVSLQSTGCLKCCKQAPNLVVLPVDVTSGLQQRSRYHQVRVAQVAEIVSKVRCYL